MRWPISLGQHNRVHQWDKFVVPLSDAEKIELTQKYHMKCQKLLNKAGRCYEKALRVYSRSHFGDETVMKDLAVYRKKILVLKESIKKRTFNKLPYVDFNKEKTKEQEFLDSYPRISMRGKLVILFVGLDMLFVGLAFLFDSFYFVPASLITVCLLVGLYLRITRKQRKLLKQSKKAGSDIW